MLIFTKWKGCENMESFNDFCKILDTDKISKVASDACKRCLEAQEDLSQEELIAICVSVSSRTCIENLRQYHEWFLKQIEK